MINLIREFPVGFFALATLIVLGIFYLIELYIVTKK